MKPKFILLIFLLLFERACDFYSTSLWFFDNPTGETNLLYRFFDVGWYGLIISNAIIIGIIIYCFYYYTYKYSVDTVGSKATNLKDYISERYYNESGKFYQVLYKVPNNKKALLGHTGYVSIRVVIIASFLATIHNFCQFYNVSFYNSYREIVGRPLFVIYGLIGLSIIYFFYKLWKIEFELVKSLK